jgi:hypothetical protein
MTRRRRGEIQMKYLKPNPTLFGHILTVTGPFSSLHARKPKLK